MFFVIYFIILFLYNINNKIFNNIKKNKQYDMNNKESKEFIYWGAQSALLYLDYIIIISYYNNLLIYNLYNQTFEKYYKNIKQFKQFATLKYFGLVNIDNNKYIIFKNNISIIFLIDKINNIFNFKFIKKQKKNKTNEKNILIILFSFFIFK